jgi:(2Fe-2S) ferredoxin
VPAPYARHVFVCLNERPPDDPRGCCSARGGKEVHEAFRRELKARNLSRAIRANKSGCLDACERGVTVVVYPEGVWYGGVTAADVPEIVESHLVGGAPVERLVFARRSEADGAPAP